jgi:hypothetical protein
MSDIVLDTDGLADFLCQYYGTADHGRGEFDRGRWLSDAAARAINRIVRTYGAQGRLSHFVIGSALAFAEVVRKWHTLTQGQLQPHQLRAFLDDPPEWFLVAAVDESLVPFFCRLPADIQTETGQVESIEWTDAVHAATAISRNESGQPRCVLRTRDHRIVRIELLSGCCV